MKVLISWSGALGKQIGSAITEWLPGALQSVKPWFSDDIEKGANWLSELTNQLKNTTFSIIVLTPEALKSDWIMFEAGATANAVRLTHACPVLFGLEPTDVIGPLAFLQHTRFAHGDFLKLFRTINSAVGEGRLEEPVVTQVFEKWWPDLQKQVLDISASAPLAPQPKRDTTEMVEEVLSLVRNMSNFSIGRISIGAAEAHVEAAKAQVLALANVQKLLSNLPAGAHLNTKELMELLILVDPAALEQAIHAKLAGELLS